MRWADFVALDAAHRVIAQRFVRGVDLLRELGDQRLLVACSVSVAGGEVRILREAAAAKTEAIRRPPFM